MKARTSAFTLIELVVVIAILALLVALLLPVLAKAKQSAQTNRCISNLKQLQVAWLTYTSDNNERLVPNKSRNDGLIQRSFAPSWVLGNAKWDPSPTNLQAGLLYSHAGATGAYRCPSDQALAKGTDQPTPRNRGYSLSGWLAGDFAGKGQQFSAQNMSAVKVKLGAIRAPSQTFVFLDEHPDSIDDGLFATWNPIHWTEPDADPEFKTWFELPSDRHNGGCNLSFADGHTEPWRWKWPKVFEGYYQPLANDLDKADLQKLQASLPTQ